MDKYLYQEVELLKSLLIGDVIIEDVYPNLVSDSELLKMCDNIMQNPDIYSEEELEELDSQIILHFASRLKKEDLMGVVEIDSGNREALIDAIIHHPEFYEDGLDLGTMENLILSSTSVPFLEKTLQDKTLPFDSISVMVITETIKNLKEIETKKQNEINSNIIINVLNGYSGFEDLLSIITDSELYNEVEKLLDGNTTAVQGSDIRKRLFEYLSTKFNIINHFEDLEQANPSTEKNELVRAIIKNPDLHLNEMEIFGLIESTKSVEFMQSILQDDSINLSPETKQIIQENIDYKLEQQKELSGEVIIETLDRNRSLDTLLDFITDPNLRDMYEEQLMLYNGVDFEFSEELLLHLAPKISISNNFWKIENMDSSKCKTDLVNIIIHHPEFYNGELTNEDIEFLVISTDSLELLEKTLADETLDLPDKSKKIIKKGIDILIERKKEEEKKLNSTKIIEVLNGNLDPKEILPLITDENLRIKFENMIKTNPILVGPNAEKIDDDIMLHLASKILKRDFKNVEDIEQGPNKISLVNEIVHHPEFFSGGLIQGNYRNLIISTNSIEFMKEILQDSEVNINDLTRERIENAIKSLEKETRKNKAPSVIDYTAEEAIAVQTYEGVSPGFGPLSSIGDAYKTMNAMLFPGLDNEFARIFEDQQSLIADAIRNPEELIDLSTLLYTAMYKYGKKMEKPAYTTRVDRTASFPEMEKRGQIISNFSTSLSTSYLAHFSKAHITLVEAEILPGAACLEFSSFFEELDKEYNFSGEREILIAPFSPITMTEVPMSEYELSIKDNNGGPPDRKVKMVVSPPPKARPLSEEEKVDRAKQEAIFNDPFRREQAASFLTNLHNYTSVEEALRSIPREEFEKYAEWKAAFQAVLKYRVREVSLEIDKGLAAERGENFIIPEPPENPELTVVPELNLPDIPVVETPPVASWEDDTLELPTITDKDLQPPITSFDDLDWPEVSPPPLNLKTDQLDLQEIPSSDLENDKVLEDLEEHINETTDDKQKLDLTLLGKLEIIAKSKPLSKLNSTISMFAEKIGLKTKDNKSQSNDEQTVD